MKFFLLACAGGAIGSGLRYAANVLAVKALGLGVAWATLFVNVAGSFAMGLLVTYLLSRSAEPSAAHVFLATGILGGFTTFSAFSLDAVALIERGEIAIAAGYVAASVIVSIAACALAFGIGRSVWT
jgi:fluoride exporter